MKFLVCISKAPDTTTKIQFSGDNTSFDTNGVQFIINPYDEWYALVRALELKESLGGSVTVINVGPADNDVIIRKALAIGADDAVRINAEANDAYFVAAEIAHYAKEQGFDMLLAGKETIDYNGSGVGGAIAALMDLPYISLCTKLDVTGDTATLEYDIDGGTQIVSCQLPMVISCQKGMAEARIPNMRGIMAARTKPLTVLEASGSDHLTAVVSYELSAGRTDCKYVDADKPEELVQLLHDTAKVI